MHRLVLLAACCGAALAAAGAGLSRSASYAPRLVVDPLSSAAGASGPITISFTQPATDLATARERVYAPPGTTLPANAPAGTVVGRANASVGSPAVRVSGRLTAADPADYAAGSCAPGLHRQVWLLTLGSLSLPVYVDRVTDPLGPVRLDLCFDPAVRVGGLDLHLGSGVLRSPARPGEMVWRGLFTPGDAAAATVESRAVLRQPLRLTLLGRLAKQGRVVLFGAVTGAGRRMPRTAVSLLAGSGPRRQKAVSSVHTGSAGRYSFTTKLKKTTFFRTQVALPARDVTATGCAAASTAPGGCVTATAQPLHLLSDTIVKVTISR